MHVYNISRMKQRSREGQRKGEKKLRQKVKSTERQQEILSIIARSSQIAYAQVIRAKIILGLAKGKSNGRIAEEIGCHANTVSKWKMRWLKKQEGLTALETELSRQEYRAEIEAVLSEEERSGRPPHFTAEQLCQIVAMACEAPEKYGYPVTHWTAKELALAAVKQGIVDSISTRHVGRFLKGVPAQAASVTILA